MRLFYRQIRQELVSSSRKLPSLDVFLRRLSQAKNAVELAGLKEGVILHHDESDGLASASLTKIALEKLGLETRLV